MNISERGKRFKKLQKVTYRGYQDFTGNHKLDASKHVVIVWGTLCIYNIKAGKKLRNLSISIQCTNIHIMYK